MFLKPVDVLCFRGNKLFGDAGSYGAALMPPWPSVAAGAIRSRMLLDAGADLHVFKNQAPPGALGRALGSVKKPGNFRLDHFGLALQRADGNVEAVYPLSADVVVSKAQDGALPTPRQIAPRALNGQGLISSMPQTLQWPVLPQDAQSKVDGGYMLSHAGWLAYLAGKPVQTDHLIPTQQSPI